MDPDLLLDDAVDERLREMGHRWPGRAPEPSPVTVGVDGSPGAELATRWAAALADRAHLVTGLSPYVSIGSKHDLASVAPAWSDQVRRAASDQLPELFDLLEGREVEHTFLEDSPAAALETVAEQIDAALHVIGHTGRGTLDRMLLGSVSERLVHHAKRPVLVARAAPGTGPIIAGLGEDDSSALGVAWAARLAQVLDRRLVIAHATPEADAPEVLGQAGGRLEVLRLPWPPREHVPALAERLGAPLVVVGHGRRPGWLGSVAIGLVRLAPCSVLVARPVGLEA